jgi:hypothetical protein
VGGFGCEEFVACSLLVSPRMIMVFYLPYLGKAGEIVLNAEVSAFVGFDFVVKNLPLDGSMRSGTKLLD